jgi:hypothetical protein
MKAYVFTDRSLERYAGQFVWLSVDIENSKNADFLKRFPIDGVPTFFVMDPAKEKVALKWLGSATVPQLTKLFDDGRKSVGGSDNALQQALARADRLYGEGKNAEAAKAYQEVLKKAPANWSRFGRTTESLLFALQASEQYDLCAETAMKAFSRVKNSPSALNVSALGLDCAVAMPKENGFRSERIAQMEIHARTTMANRQVVVAADDRSGLYISMIGAREDRGDAEGAKRITGEWAGFLEGEAAKAKNPDARAVFDSHRLSAYMELGQPERAIPMLEASERELPDDYNPPARLAVALRAMKEYDKALAASDRALQKIYGPRKLGVLTTRADIYSDMGNKEAARKTVEEAIQLAESFPEGQRSDRRIASLKKKLESLQ